MAGVTLFASNPFYLQFDHKNILTRMTSQRAPGGIKWVITRKPLGATDSVNIYCTRSISMKYIFCNASGNTNLETPIKHPANSQTRKKIWHSWQQFIFSSPCFQTVRVHTVLLQFMRHMSAAQRLILNMIRTTISRMGKRCHRCLKPNLIWLQPGHKLDLLLNCHYFLKNWYILIVMKKRNN